MDIQNKRIFLTGGAGFLGSHLAERLIEMGNYLVVFDNFSSGKRRFIDELTRNENFYLVAGDLLKYPDLIRIMKGCDYVFHLAANPEVRLGVKEPHIDIEQNILSTYKVLQAMQGSGVKNIVFTSTSAVYGEALKIPTPEDYGPLIPISLYGS